MAVANNANGARAATHGTAANASPDALATALADATAACPIAAIVDAIRGSAALNPRATAAVVTRAPIA
jgi:hypothetical protein